MAKVVKLVWKLGGALGYSTSVVEMAEMSPNLHSELRTIPLVAWKINMGDRQATLSNGSRMDGQKSKTNDDGGTDDGLAV